MRVRPESVAGRCARLSPTGTLTFLFTDIEGSTEKLTRLGDAYASILEDHHRIIRGALERNGGREVDTAGDGFFAVFDSPRSGIASAIEMQRGLGSHPWPADERVRVRMGLHTGDAAVVPTGLVGLDVHKAARIAAVSHGGQVVVSEACAALVRDLLPDGVSLRDLGSHRLKDLSRPEEIFQLEAEGLGLDFPPLRSLDDPLLKHNLPVQLTTFIGRESEIEELSGLVGAQRLVTLTGPGGAGKTRLALQVASSLLDGSGAGVWFVDLAPLSDPDLVAATVAAVLHLDEGSLREALGTRSLLVVLDNCEHVVDACAKFADGLLRACPNVHVLATSREPLGIDGEHVHPVASMALVTAEDAPLAAVYASDAVQLFADRARAHSRTFALDDATVPVVASICRRLDGIPLALELVAARLRSLSLSECESRLEDRFRLVAGGSRTALPRHQTLRATMDWSYESLHQRDRAVFDRLSVFAGGFDLAAAEGVCACAIVDAYEVDDAVSSLVDKSLVEADTTSGHARYRLNETSRMYASERLGVDADVREATHAAHSSLFLDLAEENRPRLLGSEQDAAIELLEKERDNLRSVSTRLLATPGAIRELLRLAVALRTFWVRTGTAHEGLGIVEEALTRPGSSDDPLLQANALETAGRLQLAVQAFDLARPYVEGALALGRVHCDDAFVSDLLVSLEMIQYEQGDHEGALRTADESIDAALRSGAHGVMSSAFKIRGSTRAYLSDFEGAREDFVEAVNHAEQDGDRHGLGRVLVGFASLEDEVGNLGAAKQLWERALELADPSAKNTARLALALIALRDEEVGRAAMLTLAALRAVRANPEFYGPFALILAALTLSATGRHEVAAALHGVGDAMEASALHHVWEADDARRLQAEDLERLRLALGGAGFDGAYRAGLGWDRARRLAIEHLTPIAANEGA
ncbi:MAG TPA: adenylate/guanylate cyclase domain-containing protein [Acidimicrobiales bacterium]|nr:adenylate/guanylate cyclase domain-containing protein [Acidimicrobiales bacterium]